MRGFLAAFVAGLLAAGCHSFQTRPEPDAGWRAVHLIGYLTDADLRALERDLPALAALGLNVLILEVDYHFEFRSHPELRNGAQVITRRGARHLAAACRQHGIRLIPQFQCLGHQSWEEHTGPLLTKYPELDLTPGAFPGNKGIYCREWNPLNPRVNAIVFALMDELIDAFEADAFHVGMDEVFLLGHEQSPATRGQDPARLFAQAVLDIHGHLVGARGVEMLMWGDRLIDAQATDYGEWEASANGTAPAVDLIPRDIIICDWHYGARREYPSIPMFLGKGFRVLPAGWDKVDATTALIDYARRQEHPRVLGHLFTTWSRKHALARFPPIVAGMKQLARPSPGADSASAPP